MRIAVIGSGIAGLGASWLLSREHEVTLFEADDRLGGHVHTHELEIAGERCAIDTGFIVWNPEHYPLLDRLFGELGVRSQPTTMSFSVQSAASGLEYNTTSLGALFCQRRNLVSPRFYGLLGDLVRFYRAAPRLLEGESPGPTLGQYLESNGYGTAFRDEHLVPMAAALWSAPPREVLGFPARFLVRFLMNHHMLRLTGRSPWRVVSGGSTQYVRALRARWSVRERTACPVRRVARDEGGAWIDSAAGRERYDEVVFACHSDQCLALLDDATERERDVLGAIRFQRNDVILHTDAALLPRRRRAWAAWNAWIPPGPDEPCTVSYCMNLLQGLAIRTPIIVTLNRTAAIAPERILRRLQYSHPLYSVAAVAAQQRRPEIQGQRHSWFAGAWWGWGFHEDGLRSAVEVAAALGVRWSAHERKPSQQAGPEPVPATRGPAGAAA